MKVNRIRQNVFPVLAALIWGTAFVAQSVGADYVQPFTFNAARAAIAFVFLFCLCVVLRLRRRRDFAGEAQPRPHARRDLILGGLCCGTALTVATNLQQKGLETTTSGKAGFITALYIVLVPIAGIFLKKHPPKTIWISVALAVAGLYCLCVTEGFSIARGDFYILLCAFCFTGHILIIDHFTQKLDGVELSCVQFLVAGLLATVLALLFESFTFSDILAAWVPLLYTGIISSGVGYTLQILGQRTVNPTVASLILSLESVFAVLAGWVLLGQPLSPRELVGCALVFAAVVLAQLPQKKPKVQSE